MITTTNELLQINNIDPSRVRLIRHRDKRCKKDKSVYDLWMNDKVEFDKYNSIQGFKKRAYLKSDYWMIFLGISSKETLFIGLYKIISRENLDYETKKSYLDEKYWTEEWDKYKLRLTSVGEEYIGKMKIEWGNNHRTYIQIANNQNKNIIS